MTITSDDVKKWVEQWEGQTLDFKSNGILSHADDLAELIVAFGNNKFVSENYGGRIVIGVNDNKELENFEAKQGHEESIMNIARDKCYPSINPKFEVVKIENSQVYVITIPKMTNIPYQLVTNKGKIHKIRVGSTTRDPTSHELTALYGNESNQTEEEKLLKIIPKFPNFSYPFSHLTIIPVDSNSKLFEFEKTTADLLTNSKPLAMNVQKGVLKQNEVHYKGINFPASGNAWAIINDLGYFSCMEILNSKTKLIHIGREIVFLLSIFQYIIRVYGEIGYDQRISIYYRHNGVGDYLFGVDDIMHPYHHIGKKAQVSDFTIKRTISIPSFEFKTVIMSILEEIARACNWSVNEGEFSNYYDGIIKEATELQ